MPCLGFHQEPRPEEASTVLVTELHMTVNTNSLLYLFLWSAFEKKQQQQTDFLGSERQRSERKDLLISIKLEEEKKKFEVIKLEPVELRRWRSA